MLADIVISRISSVVQELPCRTVTECTEPSGAPGCLLLKEVKRVPQCQFTHNRCVHLSCPVLSCPILSYFSYKSCSTDVRQCVRLVQTPTNVTSFRENENCDSNLIILTV